VAIPKNGHHVHSDGYRSDRGEHDPERLLDEVRDDVEQIECVTSVQRNEDIDGPYLTVEMDCHESDAIESALDGWDCRVTSVGDDWCYVRPE
jgi:hypothetical protein